MARHRTEHWPEGWTPYVLPATLKKRDLESLVDWMTAMCDWGQRLRDDLIRLEGGLGIATGDPGDPPPPPWIKK